MQLHRVHRYDRVSCITESYVTSSRAISSSGMHHHIVHMVQCSTVSHISQCMYRVHYVMAQYSTIQCDIHLKVLETWPVNCGQRSPKVFQCQRYLRPKPLEIQKDCSSQLAAHSSWRGDGGPGLSLGCRQLQLDETETW